MQTTKDEALKQLIDAAQEVVDDWKAYPIDHSARCDKLACYVEQMQRLARALAAYQEASDA